MSLRVRLILAFLTLSVVPLAAMTCYSYAGSARALREAAERQSDLLAGELTQRMQVITAQLGDRMERLADMDVESSSVVTTPLVADTEAGPADVETATPVAAGDSTLEAAVAERLGEAAMLLNNVELRGIAPPRGGPYPSGRSGRGRASTSANASDPSRVGFPLAPPRHPDPPPASMPPTADGITAPATVPAISDADAASRVTIDLAPLRRQMFRELALDRPFDQMTPDERHRVIGEVNQRLLGVQQGLELGAAELQKQADEAKRKSETAPPKAAVHATTANKRTLSGDRLDVRVEHGGPNGFVQHINAQVNLPDVLATIFSATHTGRGELLFAIGKDGRLYASTAADRDKLQGLDARVTSRDTKPGTIRLPEWIVVTTDDPTGSGLRFGIARPVGAALGDLRNTAMRTAGLGLLFIGITLVGIVPLSTQLTKNVSRLNDGVRRIAGGDYAARVAVKTNDEMGDLARAFNQMAADVERHQRDAMQQERIARELELGRQIQHDMLPKAPLTLGRAHVRGVSVAAGEVGGDFFNYFTLNANRIAMSIGDVSGKGVGAALLMSNIQASLRTRVELGQDLVPLVTELDRDIYANTPGPVYATLLVGVLDPESGVLRYVNAGHHPPFVVRKDGAIERLETSGLPVGMLAGRGYTEGQVQLAAGDLLFCYTDGCVEAEDEQGEPFGIDALERQLTAASSLAPDAVLPHMDAALRAFRGTRPAFDDATMVVVSIG